MENMQEQNVGAWILAIANIHLVVNAIAAVALLVAFNIQDTLNEGTEDIAAIEITTSDLIIGMIVIAIITLAIILILMRKKIGIYIYFTAQVFNTVDVIVAYGFSSIDPISLILPVLMAIFIWKKREVFGFQAKAEE